MEKRHYSIRWTQDETERFILARIKLEHLFAGKFYDAKSSLEKVGLELEAQLVEDDWRKLKKKWANLMDKYKVTIEPPTGFGPEEEGPRAATWPYFELMHQYCSERHNIYPPLVIDTGNEECQQRPSTSGSTTSESTPPSPHNRNRKRHEDEKEKKQLKLMEKATKLYVKYMSTLVVLSSDSSEDSD